MRYLGYCVTVCAGVVVVEHALVSCSAVSGGDGGECNGVCGEVWVPVGRVYVR